MTQPTTGKRRPLNRERALATAVALADEAGIEAVSMRNLAERLDVVPMALYKHVANKEDLLAGMVDTIVGMYEPSASSADWKSAVRSRIFSARRTLLEHPWLRHLIQSRRQGTAAVLGHLDTLAGTFMGGGLSADLTHYAMHALGHRVWGFSPEPFDAPVSIPSDPAEREAMVRHMAQTYPHIVAIAMDARGGDAAGRGPSEDEQFEITLDLLLDAFERLHEVGWGSRGLRRSNNT